VCLLLDALFEGLEGENIGGLGDVAQEVVLFDDLGALLEDLLLAFELLGSAGYVHLGDRGRHLLEFLEPLEDEAGAIDELVDFGGGLGDAHRVAGVQQQELLLVVEVNCFDLTEELLEGARCRAVPTLEVLNGGLVHW
jgi:hypothetical protein